MPSIPLSPKPADSVRALRRALRSRSVSLLVVLGVLVSAGCGAAAGPQPVQDYRFRLRTSQVLRWPVGASIRVWVGRDGRGRGGSLRPAFAAAARGWNDAARRGEYRFVRAPRPAEADVVLVWSDVDWPVDVRACPATHVGSAVTAFCVSEADPGRLKAFPTASVESGRADGVRMVVAVDAGLEAEPRRVERVVAHELGHVLGIGSHSPDPSDLMWAGRLRTAAPTAADRATVHALYDTPADIRP